MKFYRIIIILCAVLLPVSCHKQEEEPSQETGVQCSANVPDDGSVSVRWTAGDQFKVACQYAKNGATTLSAVKASTVSSIENSGLKAKFNAAFSDESKQAGPFIFYSTYPNTKTAIDVGFFACCRIPETQTPLQNSPDRAAISLVAMQEYKEFPASVDFDFFHATGYVRLDVSEIPAMNPGETVTEIRLTSPDHPLHGINKCTFASRKVEHFNDAKQGNTLRLNVSGLDLSKGIYAGVKKVRVKSGEAFNVELISSESRTCFRSFTIEGQDLVFTEGQLQIFPASFKDAVWTAPAEDMIQSVRTLACPIISAVPFDAQLDFEIIPTKGFSGNIFITDFQGIVTGVKLDGQSMIVDPAAESTSVVLETSGRGTALAGEKVIIPLPDDSKWHSVSLCIASVCSASTFTVKSETAGKTFQIHHEDFRKIARSYSEADYDLVTPTTAKGQAGQNVSRMKLATGALIGISSPATFRWTASYGMTWINPSICTNPSLTAASVQTKVTAAKKIIDETGQKIWCMHMPYIGVSLGGNNGSSDGNGDDTEQGESSGTIGNLSSREEIVAYFRDVVAACAPLQPKNLLFHAGGASLADLKQSIIDIAPAVDAIGAHMCVENLPAGVASDPSVLAGMVDEVNSLLNLTHEVRIAFDSGHAAIWCKANSNKSTTWNVVKYLKALGSRVGTVHITTNHGNNDDHVFPGFGCAPQFGTGAMWSNANWKEVIGAPDEVESGCLWGELYHTLLSDCLYRGPFVYEVLTKDVANEALAAKRFYTVGTPWYWCFNHDLYVYTKYIEYNAR